MSRYVKDLPTGLSGDQAGGIISDYMLSEGFKWVDERGEMVWRKGVGIATIPQFLKAEPADGVVHIEAWVSGIALVPGVYGGEQDLTGVWGWALKLQLKQRVTTLEGKLTGAAPVAARAPSTQQAPAAWLADPTGRHELRYWDGACWTADCADAGQESVDPV